MKHILDTLYYRIDVITKYFRYAIGISECSYHNTDFFFYALMIKNLYVTDCVHYCMMFHAIGCHIRKIIAMILYKWLRKGLRR